MIIPVLKFCHRTTLVFFEILVALVLLLLATMCVLFWKFSQGPVDITFAADAVKEALVSPDQTTDFHFDSIVAEWPEFNGPISIGLSGVKLSENSKPVLNVPQLGIRIAKAPLFIGKIHPEAVIVKDATIKLYRAKNGGVHLLVNNTPQNDTALATSSADVKTTFKELGEALFQGGTLPDYPQIQPLSKLQRFSVDNAHIVIIDEESGAGWNIPDLDFELLREENQFTMEARYQEGKDSPTNLSFLVVRSPEDKSVQFYSEIDKINISTLARLFLPVQSQKGLEFIVKSKTEASLDKDWNLLKLEGDIASDQGQFSLDGLYQSPLKFSKLEAHISYDKQSNKIMLHDTHIDINNRTLQLKGEKVASDTSYIFGLTLQVPELTFDEIHNLWPDNMKDSIAADWLVKRLSGAKITNFSVYVPIDLNNIANVNPEELDASWAFENLTADYQPPLYPATNAKGTARLKNDTLMLDIQSGKLGDMDVSRAKVSITHLTHPTAVGDVVIDADLGGNVSTVLDYIHLDPINLGEQVGIDPAKVKGTTTLNAKVVFPALKDLPKDDVKVVVDAKLNDVLLPAIVHGMDLTGGPYSLIVKDGAVSVSGKGALNHQPIDLTYLQYIDPATAPFLSSAKANIIANKALREKFGVHLDQFMDGDVPVTVEYQQNKNDDETVAINADLTPITLQFSPFKYKKKTGQGGQATANILIQKGEVRHVKDLKITIDKNGADKGGNATGNIAFGRVGKENDVKSGKFSNVTLAGANNFALDFTQTSPDVFDVVITGKQLDARPFLSGGADKDRSPDTSIVNATVKVAQMKTGDKADHLLLSPNVSLKTTAAGDVAFLDLNGNFPGGKVSVSLTPDEKGQTKLQIKSDNAGGALKALDLYDQMIGGQMDIRGTQIKGGGINDITGRGIIKNFTVIRAPILAKLINLFSLSGLTELLQNKGIEFENLKTDFEWKETKSGRVIALRNGRTAGASIGLTFGGNINQDKGSIDVSGTFVPMSEINGLFSKIPLIGNLLTGGKDGGVIAATYAMTGKSNDPTVFLNPLSVLTPGFLRSIFFESNKNIFEDNSSDDDRPIQPVKKRAYNN
ncbi:MAG TPA: hypothetical protein DCM27_08020 [Rhodospirillaceae bacterium]|nr:hypothetical protein [Rhodospirillaceae bacterium]